MGTQVRKAHDKSSAKGHQAVAPHTPAALCGHQRCPVWPIEFKSHLSGRPQRESAALPAHLLFPRPIALVEACGACQHWRRRWCCKGIQPCCGHLGTCSGCGGTDALAV